MYAAFVVYHPRTTFHWSMRANNALIPFPTTADDRREDVFISKPHAIYKPPLDFSPSWAVMPYAFMYPALIGNAT